MIFLTEPQRNFTASIDDKFAEVYPFTEANNIFKLLCSFKEEVISQIEKIYYLHSFSAEIIKVYIKIFKEYSVNLSDYKGKYWATGILGQIPDLGRNNQNNHEFDIRHLIRKTVFLSSERFAEFPKGKTAAIYLPQFKTDISEVVNQLGKDHLELYTKFSFINHLKKYDITRIDTDKYLSIKKELDHIKSFSEDPRNLRYEDKEKDQIPIKKVFEKYYNEVDNFKKIGKNKRLLFFGNEIYFVISSANEIIGGLARYYNLKENKSLNFDKSNPNVILYLNFLSPGEIYLALDQAISFPERLYFILHSEDEEIIIKRTNLTEKLRGFTKIDLPTEKEIRSSISKFFISLLSKCNSIEGNYFYLSPLMKNNKFQALIDPAWDIHLMSNILEDMRVVKEEELRSSPDIFYEIDFAIKELKNKIIEHHVIFRYDSGKFWYSIDNSIEIKLEKDLDGIIYLIIICKFIELQEEKKVKYIKVEDVIEVYNKYIDSEEKDSEDDENLDKNKKKLYMRIRRNLNTFYTKYDLIKKVFDERLEYKNGLYNFVTNSNEKYFFIVDGDKKLDKIVDKLISKKHS